MTELILLTAISRPKNIDRLIKNVQELTDKYIDTVRFTWAVCVDIYHTSEEDRSIALKKLRESGLFFVLYDAGKPNQKNYGGDMFNEALHDVYKRFYQEDGIDPWIYIFDDDNIIIEHSIDLLIHVDTECNGYDLIAGNWFMMSSGNMSVFYTNNFLVGGVDGYAINNPDPSDDFFRYSVFKEFGDFNGGLDYDFTSVRIMYYQNTHRVFLIGDCDTLEITNLHNGMKNSKDAEWLDSIGDNLEFFIKAQDRRLLSKQYNGFYVKDKDRVRRIIEILKEECQD